MAEIPTDLMYTEEHEWVHVENSTATVGITDYAQNELGDIVFIELPDVDGEVKQMDPFGSIEAVKAVSDLYSPVTGMIAEINDLLADQPELINKDPYGEGWMIKIKISDRSELDSLLSADEYKEKLE